MCAARALPTNGSVPDDERNIEIKARLGNDEDFKRRMAIARKLTNSDAEIIVQRDVFFNAQFGRFKLRFLEPPRRSELVYYERPDVSGPKLSKFNKIEVDEPHVLEKILEYTNGVKGVVSKTRYLFMYGPSRIHFDKVADLGNFIEFEVCLTLDQTIDEGQTQAEELMRKFHIKDEDLVEGAYIDELIH